jgi:photosystem II stability/assembly factor-like uncharacterized protein
MKKYAVVLAVVVLFIFASVVSVFAKDIIWDDIGGENLNLRTVLVNSGNPRSIYIGSNNAVLKSVDDGANWRNILSVRGQNKAVNFLLFDPQDKKSVYAATGNGLFYSANQGKDWKRIFRGKNYLENECTALAVLPAALYLGTKGGLFVSKDKGHSWYKETTKLGNTYILAIAYSLKEPDDIYVVCADGVFKSKDSGQSWERTFVASPTENGNETEEINEDQDEAERFSSIRYISIDPNNANYLYLATLRGVYRSQDKGQNWESLSSYGLFNRDVRFLLVSSESRLYAVTKSGVFEYMNNRWHELSLGLVVDDIRFLASDKQNNLYAACDKGLFKTRVEYCANKRQDNPISLYYKNEPNISEVQQAAIKYAEVEPGKIMRWRKQAAKKALMPRVSVGLDRNVTDLWHWEGGSTTKINDDILRRGRDSIEWDVTLSWDLSELIWNDDQTSIDVRSRLMVQLRDDILDEVTKLYFERIRVKMEMDSLTIEDRKKRFEKELKLKELTASLDALTGGYFSSHLVN